MLGFHGNAVACQRPAPDLRQALVQAGCRVTRQRDAVFQFLRSVDSHPSAEQIFQEVRHKIPNISLATVYKALEALVAAGVALKLANAEGPARYDCHCEDHYHLRCTTTGEIRDLDTPFDPNLLAKLDPRLLDRLREQGFRFTNYRLEILGEFEKNV